MANEDDAPDRPGPSSVGLWIITALAIAALLGLCVGLALIAANRT